MSSLAVIPPLPITPLETPPDLGLVEALLIAAAIFAFLYSAYFVASGCPSVQHSRSYRPRVHTAKEPSSSIFIRSIPTATLQWIFQSLLGMSVAAISWTFQSLLSISATTLRSTLRWTFDFLEYGLKSYNSGQGQSGEPPSEDESQGHWRYSPEELDTRQQEADLLAEEQRQWAENPLQGHGQHEETWPIEWEDILPGEEFRAHLESYWRQTSKVLACLVNWYIEIFYLFFRCIAWALQALSSLEIRNFSICEPIKQKFTTLWSLLPYRTPKNTLNLKSETLPPKNTNAARDPSQKSIDLTVLATETRTTLERLCKKLSSHRGSKKVLADAALDNILVMLMELESLSAPDSSEKKPSEEEGSFLLDAACIVCFAEVSDTVVMPCKHLAMCGSCCDRMGMKGKDWGRKRKAKCPICRKDVTKRVKIFRG